MNKSNFAFGKENFILLAASIIVIIIGFTLMAGGKTTEESGFNPAVFNSQRIVVAPIVTMAGFIMVVWAILIKSKDKENNK